MAHSETHSSSENMKFESTLLLLLTGLFCLTLIEQPMDWPISDREQALFEKAWEQTLAEERQEKIVKLLSDMLADYQLAFEDSTNDFGMRIPRDEHPEKLRRVLEDGDITTILNAAAVIELRTRLLLGQDGDSISSAVGFFDRYKGTLRAIETMKAPTFSRLQARLQRLQALQK